MVGSGERTVTFQEIASKKIAGVPVLYVGAGAVIILAIVAWRMKATPDTNTDGVNPEDGTAGASGDTADTGSNAGSLAGMSNPYSGFTTNGTVVVAPAGTDSTEETVTVKTNEEWARQGAEWLTSEKDVSGTTAISALTKYVNGQDRSYDEQQLVNQVIKEKGQPPDPIAEGGNVGTQAAQKQFSNFPGKHTIKGSSDDSFSEITQLYYNSASTDRVDLLQAANASLGITDGPWPIGTVITVPAYHAPVYYTVTTASGEDAQTIAKKNGLTLDQLAALNNPKGGRYAPTYHYAKGASLRVK